MLSGKWRIISVFEELDPDYTTRIIALDTEFMFEYSNLCSQPENPSSQVGLNSVYIYTASRTPCSGASYPKGYTYPWLRIHASVAAKRCQTLVVVIIQNENRELIAYIDLILYICIRIFSM